MVDSFLLTLPTLAALLYTPWAPSLQGMCPPIGCLALEHLDSGAHRRGVGILTQLWHKCLEPLSRSSTCRDCKCRDKEALREELLQWSRL